MIEKDTLYIGGEWIASTGSERIEVISPHTEEVIATVPDGTTADIDARRRRGPHRLRQQRVGHACRRPSGSTIVARFADIYAARMMDMAQVVTDEMGSPISLQPARPGPGAVDDAQQLPRAAAAPGSGRRSAPACSARRSSCAASRVGVVAAIVPWNVPQFVTMSKLAPALVSGCTMVLKPAPETPLDAYLMAELLEEAGVPEGVVNIVPAGREVGEHLVRHPGVDKVAFTGSTAAGRTIAGICGEQLKRCSLELGGKSAAIILDDADIGATMEGLKFASLMNNGQACVAQTRILASRVEVRRGRRGARARPSAA